MAQPEILVFALVVFVAVLLFLSLLWAFSGFGFGMMGPGKDGQLTNVA